VTEPCDVLIVGAGPAGAVAATVLARAGVCVRLIDRSSFPRPKLCGDTQNPAALADLRRLDLAAAVERHGLRLDGMRVTGEGGVTIDSRYPEGSHGRALARSEFDAALVADAVRAGASFEPGVSARHAFLDQRGGATVVAGARVSARGATRVMRARVTIAADGRHSTIGFGLRLARHPNSVRRWAIGAHAEGVAGLTPFGEMHIRRGA
jgi:flavin-dependent dehydrogenase